MSNKLHAHEALDACVHKLVLHLTHPWDMASAGDVTFTAGLRDVILLLVTSGKTAVILTNDDMLATLQPSTDMGSRLHRGL